MSLLWVRDHPSSSSLHAELVSMHFNKWGNKTNIKIPPKNDFPYIGLWEHLFVQELWCCKIAHFKCIKTSFVWNKHQFSWSLLPNRTMATFLKCHHSFRYKMITTCLSECPQVENWNIPFQFLYFSSTTLTVFPVLQARVMPVYKLAQSIFTVLSAGRHSWHIFHTLFKIME